MYVTYERIAHRFFHVLNRLNLGIDLFHLYGQWGDISFIVTEVLFLVHSIDALLEWSHSSGFIQSLELELCHDATHSSRMRVRKNNKDGPA